jgi:pullulanase/glycogen debranching enzyme
MKRHHFLLSLLFLPMLSFAQPPTTVLTPTNRVMPGLPPTPFLAYQPTSRVATIHFATSADGWAGRYPLTRQPQYWQLDIRPLDLPVGRHEFKFILDDEWEPGANRTLFINRQGVLEQPLNHVKTARVQGRNLIEVFLRDGQSNAQRVRVETRPPLPIEQVRLSTAAEEGYPQGYAIHGNDITFYFDPATYDLTVSPNDLIALAGNFNGWDASGRQGQWQLTKVAGVGLWELTVQLDGLRPPPGQQHLEFKFVVNQSNWLTAPDRAPNRAPDGRGNVNLRIDPTLRGGRTLRIYTGAPIDLDTNYLLIIDGLADRAVYHYTTPGLLLDSLYSDKPLGATLNREHNTTTYRLFAPRATDVYLCFFDTPHYQVYEPEYQRLPPKERYRMWKDPVDGVWELTTWGLDIGAYYAYQIDGPAGEGESFYPDVYVGDPYAVAAAGDAEYNNIVLDTTATNQWFAGWTDDEFRTPAHEDMIIYETHLRDLTAHPSSGVPPSLRGTYAGLLATTESDTGLGYLKDLGVNMIELLPMQEFPNPNNRYDWGYATVFFFAPESSYGANPAQGSPFYEFKNLVNHLHNEGFGVMLDVVYNHVGGPNIFSLIDRKYYFRLNPDFSHSNFSGVGNDIRSEAPMMRRLIVENIIYLMEEFHIDGFRFDLAELIDLKTLMMVRDAALKVNPNVVLVSEPWSFRGTHKYELTGTGWAAWNDYFRNGVKGYVMGDRNLDRLKQVILGSTELWTDNPLQSVNYVESHDDMSLMDELTTAPDRDGRRLQPRDVAANRLSATVLFTSLGIPMIQSGQEFLRSKHGVGNTYNRGDELNALRWTDRDRPVAAEALAYYRALMHLRQSPAGQAFRVNGTPPDGYYRWIETRSDQALGYIVNAPRIHPGNGFIVLLNAHHAAVDFRVALPNGRWRLIGNGRQLDPAGLPDSQVLSGPANSTISVPAMSSVILMDGF